MADLFVVVGGAVFLTLVSLWVYRRNDGEVTLTEFVGYLAFQVIVILVILIYALPKSKFTLLLMLPLLLPNFAILAGIVGGFLGKNTIGDMFFPQMAKPVKNKLGSMKAALWDEDVPGAVRACLDQFEQYPDEYDILLDGARLLQDRGSYLESLKLLQRVMDALYNNQTAWSQAAYRAASIRMEHLDDKETACMLFRKIADRMPDAEVGMRARERMHGDGYTMKRPEPAKHWYQDETNAHEKKEIQQDADPFYRKRPTKPQQTTEETDSPNTAAPALDDEMPDMFIDEDSRLSK